ncbi:PIR protein [Plasmodium ovale]|uniref:PIR protein n=1 Tax=Plasmodium ovale TaxID=36330 RepID=A0A1D3JCS4_PLAOA|nr:PIR protein [Plasmodium ovale]
MKQCSKILPSKRFYNKLQSEKSSLEKCNEHRNFLSTHGDNTEIIQLCGQIINILSDNSLKVDKKNNTCNRCKLLSYWIYSKLDEIFSNEDEKNYVIFTDLQRVWDKVMEELGYPKENTCQLDALIILDKNWKAMKAYYEHCVDYNQIFKRRKPKDSTCDEYDNYIEEKFSQYKEFYKTFLEEKLKKCSENYKKRKKCDVKLELTELMDGKKDSVAENPEQLLTQESFISKVKAILEQQGRLGEIDSSQYVLALIEKLREYNKSTSKSLPSLIISIVISLAGIFLIFFFWYRFTPYGAILRVVVNKIRKYRHYRRHKKAQKMLEDMVKPKRRSLFCIPYNST